MSRTDANSWIAALRLAPHPEGGHYRETYRASGRIPKRGLPRRYPGPRPFSTAILFLLRGSECSRLHRLKSDELWHFYDGSPLTVHVIRRDGRYRRLALGMHPERGERLQSLVPAGCWFGATVDDPSSFTLAGCTAAPGFDFADFELARRQDLLRRFPRHRAIIEKLSSPPGPIRD